MFEVGFTEILLIFAIALLVLGPARLPKLAADLGRWAGRARSMARQLRTQLEQEVQFDPLADDASKRSNSPNTIHAPPPAAPAPASPPSLETNAAPPAVTAAVPVVDPEARALPAQVADVPAARTEPPPPGDDAGQSTAQRSLFFPDAMAQPDKNTDVPKPV